MSELAELEASSNALGDFVGTGMLGGRIYIRGKVDAANHGNLPHRTDVENYLDVMNQEGLNRRDAQESP